MGRRLSVPQKFYDDEGEDDGLLFGASVILAEPGPRGRVLVRFDYTADEEWFPMILARRWVQQEVDIGLDSLTVK